MSTARTLLLLTPAALGAACSVIFSLDGFDTGRDGGGGGAADAGPGDAAEEEASPCSGAADGTQWDPSDPFARCCGGVATHTTNDPNNCGVCGLKCNPGQTCAQQDPASDPHAIFCGPCKPGECGGGLC